MSDLHNILNKFNSLGIVNKGLTVDGPIGAPKKQDSTEVSPSSHAKQVNEIVGKKFIPGVSDVSANDFAALAGIKRQSTGTMYAEQPKRQPQQQSTATMQSQSTSNADWNKVMNRLDSMEEKLNKMFESLNPAPWKKSLNEDVEVQEGDLIIKRPAFNHAMQSAMDDLLWKTTKNPEMIPLVQKLYKLATGKDVEYDSDKDSFTIKAKPKELSPAEKIIAKTKKELNTEDTLKSEFASFLKELENFKK